MEKNNTGKDNENIRAIVRWSTRHKQNSRKRIYTRYELNPE